MTINFAEPPPHDIQIERQVDQAILNGCVLPRWGWPMPSPYNGSTGPERVSGWQKLIIAERLGLLGPRGHCSLCDGGPAEQMHTELYARPILSSAVCRSCHYRVHRRFRDMRGWQAFLTTFKLDAHHWAKSLWLSELSRAAALEIAQHADIFAALAELSARGDPSNHE